MNQTKLFWIDVVKAICMMSVYILHSEAYYGVADISYGYILKPFYVNAFFFVSGYLFFKKNTYNNTLVKIDAEGYRQAFANILFRLIIPAILFSTFFFLSKMLFHGNNSSIENYIFNVFGGISYWFTSALTIAQIVLLILFLFRKESIWFYVVVTMVLFFFGLSLNLLRVSNDTAAFFPWFYKTGLVYTFVMVLGGLYYFYETTIEKYVRYSLIVVALVYVGTIIMTWDEQSIKAIGLSGICNFSGFITMVCGIVLLIKITKCLKYISWIEFIGRNSIVFYFLSGVLPAACGTVASYLEPEKYYIITIIVAIVSMVIAYGITWVINKYMPFLIDFRKIK